MRVGVLKEIKDSENRVALTPAGAATLVKAGHSVLIQEGAGAGSGFGDEEYRQAGAETVSVDAAWAADLIVKVKEPLESEYGHLRDQILFTYLHLAGVSPTLTHTLLERGTAGVAYETLEDASGRLPLLAPMSAIAGNMSITLGSYYLARFNHGRGMLLGTVLGKRYGKVVVIGDGVVGRHAARTAVGLGTDTFIGSRRPEREPRLKQEISETVSFFITTPENIATLLEDADLVVGAVLLPGAKAPHVVSEDMVKRMQPGSVIVDVSIDQGGCVATSRPTLHSEPVYEKHGVIHYCVTNMPGAYPRTSTMALTAATLPYVLKLAERGIAALREDPGFAKALNTYKGCVTYRPVAEALDLLPRFREFTQLRD